jgi:hypothetical protein
LNIGYSGPYFPFSVPDHIWSVALDERDKFPSSFKSNAQPWRRNNLGVS